MLQKTSWGYIEWLSNKWGENSSKAVSVGLVTINPHTRTAPHIHYESEQFIYIIQGAAIDICDGTERHYQKDSFYYLDANITHELINPGDEEMKHLLVTVPNGPDVPVVLDGEELSDYSSSFCAAVEAIRNPLLDSASLPITIFDDLGNILLQNDNFPTFCMKRCDPKNKSCYCLSPLPSGEALVAARKEVCPHGLTFYSYPVAYNNDYLGDIRSGHILLSDEPAANKDNSPCANDPELYDTPTATAIAIQQWLNNIVKTLLSFCGFNSLRQSINAKNILLAQTQSKQHVLEEDLRTMNTMVTNLKINHHFLFNTLNAIAGQALEADRMTTFQTIVDLAKMFRYTMATDLRAVELRMEVEYMNTYLNMQKIRFHNNLDIEEDIESGLANQLVPFNFLQPIIENAFQHGFQDYNGVKKISITIKKEGDWIAFYIANNGAHIDEITLRRVENGLSGNSGHGLSLVYTKLQAMYGGNFTMNLGYDATDRVTVRVLIPYSYQQEQENDGK